MTRHIVAPAWITDGYEFPSDVKLTNGDDLADVDPVDLADADFVVLPYMGSSISDEEAFSRMTSVKIIHTLTAGFNSVAPLVPSGVTLCNLSGVHDAGTAEMAVLLMLSSMRRMPEVQHAQDRSEWIHLWGTSPADKTVLLIGYGGVGKAVEQRLLGFECMVIPVATHARDHVHAISDLDSLIPQADIIFLTVPLNNETEGLIDARRIAMMKPGTLLVNVARGPVVDTQAMLEALHSGHISAALDVTDPEPLPANHPLWTAPNTVIAPHIGADNDVLEPRARRRMHGQFDLWLAGKPLESVVPL